jgi:pyruvate dehydrogenase E2 component (dihydrolipoamide acetyltransferase)
MVMPQVSITTAEVKLVSWLKKPGDPVKRGEPLVEVETDKATVEVESYADGYLRVAKYPDGATVPLDAVIAILTTTPDEKLEDRPVASAGAALRPPEPVSAPAPKPASGNANKGRLDITPVARKLAEDNRLDPASLHGSGPDGRILRADVEAALQARGSAGSEGPGAAAGYSSMRSAIAQRTTLSKASIPHYYVSIDIDMQAALDLVADLKKLAADRNIGVPTLTDVILLVCGRILPQFPLLHGSWTDKGPRVNPEINIGLVVGLDEGLIVPVVRQADRLGLSAVAETTRLLKQKARQGGLGSRELTGGTFTISNLGMFGVSSFIAVINPPESAILALGATAKRAVANASDQVVVRPVMTTTLSVDHRMIDGIVAARFLNALKEKLEAPVLLMFDL